MAFSTLHARLGVLIAATLVFLTSATAQAVTLYVAVDGNDSWSGRLERPNAAKQRRAAGVVGRRPRRRAAAEGPWTIDRGG